MKRLLIVTLTLMALMAVALPAQAQHGEDIGHLPPVQKNVQVLGKLDLFKDGEQPGRIADVGVYGDYAYLGVFASPNCEDLGVYVIDISDPTQPKQVEFIPTSDPSSFVGEGVQVLEMNTEFYKGPLLLYSQETCLPNGQPALGNDPRLGLGGPGGATLVDVRNPLEWEKLADHVGDEDPSEFGIPHNSHSVFGWQQGDKAYMVVMDNGETTDIDIFDITNPAAPEFVLETGFPDFPQITEDPPPNGASPFIHDFVVKKVGEQYLFLGSYWDGGYIILDFTNLPNDVTFLRDTDFGPEPFAAELGLPASTPAEGNGHQAEFNFDSSMFIGADEDFQAFRFLGEITSGTFDGDTFSGIPGSDTPPIPADGLEGPTSFVGGACGAITPTPSADHIALIDRDPGCSFTVKVNAAEAAGYKAAVIFNNRTSDAPNCDASINMLAIGNIPSLGVGRSTGLKLLGVDPGPD
ncbi:MAG: PA domain-containing protein, partial [Actinomycetota bacterium]